MNVLCLFLLGSFVASVNTFITNTETSSYNQEETVSTCARNQFRCNSGHCIPANWHCDSHPDCDDNSDETAECQQNQNCRPEQFQCVFTKKCIPKGWVCDGEKDCGISSEYGQDLSDEDPKNCTKDLTCKWNEAPCGEGLECLPIKKFCDGHGDCLGNSDEWDFCQNQTITCNRLQCSFGCNQTPKGPKCYCPEGQKPEGAKCIDANECELDDSCAQLCTNTQGSFECSCVSGYKQNGTDCIAINIPASEPASLIFSTQSEIRRITMEGKAFPGNSTMRLLNSNALEFIHRNHTVCYVHHNITKSSIMCANVDDLNNRWVVPALSPLIEVEAIQQIAVDWISQNWYFMDDQREVILVCSNDLRWCKILVESDLSKPIALCVDPTSGFLFFTKWGHSPPMLERINMDGSGRRPIVDHTIVYPYGVAVDFPTKQVYWVDTYLDYVERVDYNGQNRKTVIRGLKVQNLYGISLFQNKVFVSSWYNNSLLEVGKFSETDKTIISNISRPFNVYVFHRQRQPDVAHPCKSKNDCDHLCIPSWKNQIALKKCICASGYTLLNSTACALKTPPTFLLLSRSAPFSIRAIDPASGTETMVPITRIGRPKGLDFDAITNAVFFSDTHSMTVEMAPLNDTAARTVLLDDVLCDGLAFDWLSRNLYWTSVEGGTVNVAKLSDTRVRRTLARSSNPTSIAVNPAFGVMYWAAWSSVSPENGSIESAHMDGGGRRSFLVENVHWPSGLAVDAAGGRLYWSDKHLRIIQSVDFNGGSRRTEIANGIQSPVSVAVNTRLREHLYYIEMSKGSIMSYSNETGLRKIYEGNVPPFEIKLFDAEAQRTTGNHSCANSTCPELCLPIPGNKSVCACSDGFEWQNGACVKQQNLTTPSFCAPATFRCSHKKRCIPNTYLCDGVDNCGDGSDESADAGGPCANVSCGENQMKCDNTTCIAKHWVCDGEKDCVDGSDENPEVCSKICSSAQFKCKQSRRCIPLVWRCDNVYDCGYGDHSDELECNSTSCDVNEFTCKNGQCIAAGFYCDSVQDCDDGSDEVDCTSCDPAVEIPCKPLDKCLPRSAQCDGKVACPDGSDEKDCGPKVECEPEEFVCTNFECIPKVFVCDSDLDCEDGSDEMKCDPMKLKNATESKKPILNCDSPYKLCDNNTKCISLEKLCDNRQDCADGTDEGGRLCNDQNSTESKMALSCEYPSRTCDNDTKCITVDQLCDDRPDCVDGSDEGMRCADMLCDHSFLCSHDCHNAPEGLICTCPSHLHLQADKTHCLETHPCQAWDVCSQICIPRGSRYKCTCQKGYVMQEDGFTCKSTDSGRPFVIFSNRHEIRGIDLHTFNLKSFIPSLKNTITLDFYHSNGTDMIFWTDVIDDKIYRGTVIGGSLGNIEVVVQSGLSTAEGLAVDWIGQNLYWVESNLDQIEVAKLNGSYRRTLVAGDMESPRAVAVDPRDGYLFWTDWDNLLPRIERCSMAGSDRKIVVKVNNNGWPNGLTLDYTTRRIYWIDARSDSIHTSNYEGGDHHEVMRNHEMLSHPFAITVFENYVYWTDWRTNSVVRANKWTGGDVKVMQKTLTQPFDIKIMHPSRQPRDGADPCGGDNNGGCSHLCLLHLNGTYKCDCPHIMKLGDDAKTCVVNDKVLLISRNSEIRGVDIVQPYYHTIPTISVPQVFVPVQLEYLARNNTLYWADSHINEVKRSSLTHGPSETLIDTGLQNPTGIAVDWTSDLLFVSSKSGVTVTNLNGEYSLGLVEATSVLCIAIHPKLGRIFWISADNGTEEYLESSAMDGSARRIIARLEKSHSKSLTVDAEASKLYWINGNEVFYADLDGRAVRRLPLDGRANISALTVYHDALYYANDTDSSIHSVDKRTGESDDVLRNGTGGVLALKIYDPKEQTGGSHPCGDRERHCQHLCLPSNATSFSCACATGYRVDRRDPTKCEGVEEFLFYSLNWELRGLPLEGGAQAQVLGPISRISSATAIDFAAEQELIYWADSDRGVVSRVRRDGTARQQVLEQSEVMENWLTGIAVDWVAGNMYWCDSKRGTVEVARLDGSTSHVLLPYETGKISSIAVDPVKGWLVWAGGWKMEIATMDGQNRRVLVEDAKAIADVALDSGNGFVYFSDVQSNTIERIGYDGKGREVMLNHSLENPVALTVFMGKVYWLDASHLSGSIKAAPITNMSAFDVLESNLNDSLKDIQIFSKRKQNGTNACAKDNGGCEQLCLFNGTHPVCVCSHGRISSDGKTCEAFESFVMYSRVVSIDSIQMMGDKNLQNSPQPSIRNNTMLKNAIGLSFSYKHQRLFYSDIQRGSINAVFFNGTDHKVVVDRQGSVEGLAYEQVHNSLYWTCNIDATINRVNLTDEMSNSSAVETIVSMRQQDKPRGIAIDSCGNRVYWTNWHSHQPSVERAYLTGFGREAIIETDIRMPNAITLDHKAQKLYWGDARLDKIERCEYDGTKRVVLAKVTPQHPFALAVYGDFIYWTDWILHAVIRADKFTGQYVVLLRRDVARPMGIVTVANDTEDCFSNSCLVQNGFCEEICGLTASGQVECSCREGRVLSEDGRCQAQTFMNCTNNGDSFRCSDGGCVPFHLTCDNIAHCADSSDEEPGYCGYRTCPLGWFACRNRRCVFANLTCDGVDDCGDSTDERDCSCALGQFRCGDGTCIEAAHRCDNEPDCRDRSDEIGCAMPNCVESQGKDFVNCERTTACIHKDWFCDNEDDCWDNSDEANCTVVKPICERGYFRCSNGACVNMTARCDGRADCNDMEFNDGVSSDELNCGPDNKCRYDQFLCDNGSTCIPLTSKCNGEKDCPDDSDEFNCKQHCHTDQFQCGNKDCIPKSWQCDGNPDCTDHSDESEHCQKTSCPKYEFRCNSTGRCIPLTWMCDGEADCQDGADEHILQGCAFNSCTESKFSCADGQCIDTIYYCDGDRDCTDGSDEPSDCYKTCLAGEFQCANEKCIADLMRCDGKDDCGDDSDEEGCETTQEEEEQDVYCKGGGWFRCENGVCINETLLCNGENNCGDFSDEAKCGIDECSASPSPCAQICVDKPVGYECQCKQGYRVDTKDRHRCDDVDECAQKPCSQVCRNTRGSYHCSCHENYVLHTDKKSCRANSTVKVNLVLANRYYIRELDLSGHSSLLAHNLTNAVALDYDWQEQCIYWSDVTQLVSSIKRMCDYKNDRSATEAETLHSPTLQNPDGLAVDWIGRNLYWCDKGLDTIEVSSLSGKFRKVLHSKGLEEPRALALDPTRGYMYWSDWGTRVHIGKAAMDGSNPRSIVTTHLGWPNALTISYETEELFWADAREDYIAVADLEGRHVRIVASRQKQPRLQLHHVFAIDVWEDHVYWTDWETKSVERCNKYSGEDCESILSTVHRPMDIRVVHPFRQPPGGKRNPCSEANCSALCLLVPEEPYYTCACPENFVLGDDGRSCEANCTSAHFECRTSLRCIPFWWKCDTQDDCGDGSDEPADCPKFRCRPGQYQCKNEHCIHPSDLCNGKDDCGDKSDESECEHYSCLNTQFRCEGNGTVPPVCITSKQRCNKIVDCALGEDEADCPPATCPPNQFKCDNDKCIPTVWVCDRDNDCLDNSDEQQDCDSRTCGPQHIRCNSGRCIPKTWLCDGDHDCAEGEDEPPTCSRPEYHTCEPSYFKCKNNKCIPGRWRCDYEDDCGDGSDEVGCAPRNCSESEFRCQNGRCIRGDLKCDGEYQCDDRSDEVDCHTQCKDNEFQCSNPKLCIFLSWKCDADTDCPDGSDEANCTESCPHNGFKCADGACVNEQWRCDGQNDCDDGSDEQACFSIACPAGRFRCKSHRCVPMFALCDGKDQCGDGSDEDKHICRRYRLCPSKQFTCKNGRCIDATLKCDGSNDCADDSDETDCPTSACKWDTCSQICVETRQNQTTCKCVAGYQNTEAGNCQALGGLANLVLAVEAELRLVSPYKFGIDTDNRVVKTLATAPGYKVDAVDILSAGRQAETFWTDHQNKRVQSMIIQIDKDGRANRDADVAKTVLSNLHDPRGLTLDWIARRIYVTDGSRILAATFDGAYSYTLASGNVHQPRSIVVSPAHGLVFWADWGGPGARIETAHMDGYKRKVLVSSGVLWPTDLAMDYGGGRLYWADPKTMTVESVKVDGSDRRVVRSFELDTRPYKIEIFEDNLFVSSLHKHDLFRMNKFGKGNVTYLSQSLTRISDILILHESKHPKMPNSCTDYCNDSEFCLLTPSSATCTCADGFVKDNLTCRAASATPPGCPLNCHTGTCKVVQGRGPKCVCPPQYSGANCEHYRCSQYCKNHGLCYVDVNAKKSPDAPAPLKCNCPPLWTGERCETLVDVCVNWCYNGGNCTSKSGDPHCHCPIGFSGNRCQACFDFHCENGGFCTVKNAGDGRRSCSCPPGYTGPLCEVSLCGKHGRPIGTPGGFKCSCTSGYRGDKCEQNGCDKHCLNGGTCKMGTKEPVCTCPPLFTGRRCETKMCTERYPPAGCSDKCQCQHGGVCVKPNEDTDDLVCQCPLLWGGLKCETYILGLNPCKNRCLNNGVCVLPSQGGRAECHCTKRWTGDNCEVPVECASFCHNGGSCSLNTTDRNPFCVCPNGYKGTHCEEVPYDLDAHSGKESRGIWVPVISAVAVIVVVLLAGFLLFEYFFKNRTSFAHARLQENDFSNPIFQERDAEPFTLDTDKSSNFANPVYESMYNATPSGKDEKAVLLEHSVDETPPQTSEEN